MKFKVLNILDLDEDQITFDKFPDFGRSEFATKLSQMIAQSDDESLVMGINGKWGEGKSAFVKMWQNKLLNGVKVKDKKNIKINTIYFDAFKHDFTDNPLIDIASCLLSKTDIKIEEKKKVNELAMDLINEVILPAGGVALNKFALGWIDSNILSNIKGVFIRRKKCKNDDLYNKNILNFDNKIKSIEKFKEELKTVFTDNKTVFFIDELDRCKPGYAISIIETVKHFFSVKNLFFVLTYNKEQLNRHLEHKYGKSTENTYLDKFIDLEFALPKEVEDPVTIHYKDYTKYLSKSYPELFKKFNKDIEYASDIFAHVSLSLRDLNMIIMQLNIIFQNINLLPYDKAFFDIILLLLILKQVDYELFLEAWQTKGYSKELYEKVVSKLGLPMQEEYFSFPLRYCLLKEDTDGIKYFNNTNLEKENIFRKCFDVLSYI